MTLDKVRRLKRLILKRANGDEEDMSGPAPSENSVLEFIKRNPRPKDKKFHEWAEGKGVNVHKAEAKAYGIISDLMNKGRSKGKHPAGVNRADVNKGVKIEAEHTPNKEIQRKITDDHNTELKKYYDPKKGLPAMEKKLEKEGGLGRVAGHAKWRWEQMQKAKEKKGTIVKPTGALQSNLGPLRKTAVFQHEGKWFATLPPNAVPDETDRRAAAFMSGLVDELQKLGYNGGAATATIRPGTTESKTLRKALKAKGVWKGKSPGILQRAAHGLRRLGRPSPTAHLKVTKKPTSEREQAKDISRALGGSFSSIPSIPKVALLHGFIEKLGVTLGVTFGKSPGKPMKMSARIRRLKRFVSGAPKLQLRRMRFKQQARKAAHAFGGSEKDLRGAARGGKMMLGAGLAMLKREARLSVRAGKRIKGMGPAIAGLIRRNPELAFMVAVPPAVLGGAAAAGGLAKLLTPKKKKKSLKKKGMEKEAGPPTLAKLRRAYPKGKVKPPVADPSTITKGGPEFPKAAKIIGGDMNSVTKAFFIGLTDELEKAGKCGKPHDKKAKKGLVLGKRAMDDGAGSPTAMGASIKAKIQAAKADPSTKANPKDSGPKGSGLDDPRMQEQKGRGFGKEAWGGGLDKAKELNKHIQAAGGNVPAGVKAYNKAKKGEKGEKKGVTKKAEEAFFGGFDEGLGKEAEASKGLLSAVKAMAPDALSVLQGLRASIST